MDSWGKKLENLCQVLIVSLPILSSPTSLVFFFFFFFQLVFTPCNAEQPLPSMELQGKEAQKG